MSLKLTVSSEKKKRLNFIWIKQRPTLYSARKDRFFLGIMLNAYVAVESRSNEPLHNEVLDITNDFPFPSNSKIYEKEPRYSGTCRYN